MGTRTRYKDKPSRHPWISCKLLWCAWQREAHPFPHSSERPHARNESPQAPADLSGLHCMHPIQGLIQLPFQPSLYPSFPRWKMIDFTCWKQGMGNWNLNRWDLYSFSIRRVCCREWDLHLDDGYRQISTARAPLDTAHDKSCPGKSTTQSSTHLKASERSNWRLGICSYLGQIRKIHQLDIIEVAFCFICTKQLWSLQFRKSAVSSHSCLASCFCS